MDEKIASENLSRRLRGTQPRYSYLGCSVEMMKIVPEGSGCTLRGQTWRWLRVGIPGREKAKPQSYDTCLRTFSGSLDLPLLYSGKTVERES